MSKLLNEFNLLLKQWNNKSLHDIYVGGRKFNVELPESPEVGLGFRPMIPQDNGMLFVVTGDGKPKFTMQNMNFPLDFICIGHNNEVLRVMRNVPPVQNMVMEFPFCKYVLEVQAGAADGINIGDVFTNIDGLFTKQDGGGGGGAGGDSGGSGSDSSSGGGTFLSSEDAGTITFGGGGKEKKIKKQLAVSDLGRTGEFSMYPNLPRKSGYSGESDKIREMSEKGILNRAIQDGMTDEEWNRKQYEKYERYERLESLYEHEGDRRKIKQLNSYLRSIDMKKASTPESRAWAKERGLVPQSGNWDSPVRWVKQKDANNQHQEEKQKESKDVKSSKNQDGNKEEEKPKKTSSRKSKKQARIEELEQEKLEYQKYATEVIESKLGDSDRKIYQDILLKADYWGLGREFIGEAMYDLFNEYSWVLEDDEVNAKYDFLSNFENFTLKEYQTDYSVNKFLYDSFDERFDLSTNSGKYMFAKGLVMYHYIDSAFTNENFETKKKGTFYRGVGEDEFEYIREVYMGEDAGYDDEYFYKESYTSVSKGLETPQFFADDASYDAGYDIPVIKVVVPKGSKAISMSQFGMEFQEEYLLPSDSSFKVSYSRKENTYILTLINE